MTCCYEPLKSIPGKKVERRDGLHKKTLGNTGKPRKRPHKGLDWGYIGGSMGEDYYAVHGGTVTAITSTGELGELIIVKRDGCQEEGCVGAYDEYCHSAEKSPLKVGDKVVGGRTVLNQIGDKGSPGAPHLHLSSAYASVPHNAPTAKLRDVFAEIDKSSAQRRANMEAKKLNA